MSEATVLTLQQLQEAVAGRAAALRCRSRLQPAGGPGDKVFPPTYVGGVYAVEDRRIDGRVVRCVLLDSVQSQANRMEEVLLQAFLPNWRELKTDGPDPKCDLPVLAVYVENHGWVTSLTAPHRIHDAILRDSNLNGTRFRDSEIGEAVVKSRLHDATAFYRYCPTALLFGTWDSTAGEGLDAAKIPRAIVSEIIGVEITPGVRTGSRIDPLGIKAESATVYRLEHRKDDWTLDEAEAAKTDNGQAKKFGEGKPSDINHGNLPPRMPRFKGDEIRNQQLGRLPDILECNPIKLRYDVESGDGRLQSHTALDGETVRIREGAVKPGGVTMAYALHTWTLSLTQLRRLRFPVEGKHNNDPNNAARTVLAALALYAFALQQERGWWLRSRCELIPEGSLMLEFVGRSTSSESVTLGSAEDVREKLLNPAIAGAKNYGLEWEARVIRLTPTEKLAKLVRLSDALQVSEEAEEQEVAHAGDQD